MSKYLILVLLLVGCSNNYTNLQHNIDAFTRDCKALSKCLNKPYEVITNLTSRHKLTCKIIYSDVTHAHLYVNAHLDLEERPTFGYDFLKSANEVCKMNNQLGDYTKANQDAQYRYVKCINLKPNDESQRKACWTQYRNGDFYDE